jgi:hypothetical protein
MHGVQRDAGVAVASTETMVAAALEPLASPIAGALWAFPSCMTPPRLLVSELDTSFVSARARFLDPFRTSNPVPTCVSRFRLLNDVQHSVEKDGDGITMMETGTDAGFDNTVPPAPTASPTPHVVSNFPSRASLTQDSFREHALQESPYDFDGAAYASSVVALYMCSWHGASTICFRTHPS